MRVDWSWFDLCWSNEELFKAGILQKQTEECDNSTTKQKQGFALSFRNLKKNLVVTLNARQLSNLAEIEPFCIKHGKHCTNPQIKDI